MSESEQITRVVTIKDVTVKDGPQDDERPWKKFTLIDDKDRKQSTFDKKVGAYLVSMIGKKVEIVVAKDGRYWNLVSAKDAPQGASTESPTTGNGQYDAETIARFDLKDRRIAREASLHAVTRLHGGTGAELGSILLLAEKAFDWIYEKGKPSQSVTPPVPQAPDVSDRIAETMAKESEGRVVTRVESMAVKTTDGGAKRFRVHTSSDEDFYTFSDTLAQILKKAKERNQIVSLTFVARDFGNEITEAQTVQGATIEGEEVVVE